MAEKERVANQARAAELVKREWKMLIGGASVAAEDGQTYETRDPARGELLARVPFAGRNDVARAVDAARGAFAAWRNTSILERVQKLQQCVAALRANARDLAILDAIDSGNPVKAMQDDVNMAAGILSYYCGIAPEVKGATIPASPTNLHMTLREPYGVVGRIIPYNHPILFAASKLGPPLIMGNTVVMKAPDQTPLSALYLGELIRDIFPPGTVNILTGDGATTGDALVRHPEIKRLALTGSVETGLRVQASAAQVGIKHVSLELGGKNPMIVFPDADLDRAVEGAVQGMNFTWCQGQSCGSTSRLFLHRKIHEAFVAKLRKRVAAIRIGDPLDPETEMGSLVSKEQFEKVSRYIGIAREGGASVVAGGGRPSGDTFRNGFFVAPTVLDAVTAESRVAQEEIFGPVLSVLVWDDEEEVVRKANSVKYGLTGAVWTNDINAALRVSRALDCGYVWINGSSTHYPGVPFGGHKASGLDVEDGIEELLSFTQLKSVNVIVQKS